MINSECTITKFNSVSLFSSANYVRVLFSKNESGLKPQPFLTVHSIQSFKTYALSYLNTTITQTILVVSMPHSSLFLVYNPDCIPLLHLGGKKCLATDSRIYVID